MALSVSCVMEWNISLAIFLATKCVLLFGSYFLRFLVRWASAGWRKTILISVRSTGPRPLVLNRAGLASAAAIRAGLLGRGLLGWEWYFVDLGSIALGFIYLGSCAATELRNSGMSLTWFRAESSGQTCHSPKDVATKLSNRGAVSSSWSAPSHIRYSDQKPWVGSQADLSLLSRQLQMPLTF